MNYSQRDRKPLAGESGTRTILTCRDCSTVLGNYPAASPTLAGDILNTISLHNTVCPSAAAEPKAEENPEWLGAEKAV